MGREAPVTSSQASPPGTSCSRSPGGLHLPRPRSCLRNEAPRQRGVWESSKGRGLVGACPPRLQAERRRGPWARPEASGRRIRPRRTPVTRVTEGHDGLSVPRDPQELTCHHLRSKQFSRETQGRAVWCRGRRHGPGGQEHRLGAGAGVGTERPGGQRGIFPRPTCPPPF